MKNLIYLFALLLFACGETTTQEHTDKDHSTISSTSSKPAKVEEKYDTSWKGTIRGDIPVSLHYQAVEDLVVGEMVYLNTDAKEPIRVVGTIEADSSLRLAEFDKKGNITGIISGTPKADKLSGNWFSPKTRDGFEVALTLSEEKIPSENLATDKHQIFGEYAYQFGMKGYQGSLTVEKVDEHRASIDLTAVTEHPGRNIASIEKDTIDLNGTSFTYVIPNTDNCGVKFSFYKDFVSINYTNGYCQGAFGHNATVDGVFYKTK